MFGVVLLSGRPLSLGPLSEGVCSQVCAVWLSCREEGRCVLPKTLSVPGRDLDSLFPAPTQGQECPPVSPLPHLSDPCCALSPAGTPACIYPLQARYSLPRLNRCMENSKDRAEGRGEVCCSRSLKGLPTPGLMAETKKISQLKSTADFPAGSREPLDIKLTLIRCSRRRGGRRTQIGKGLIRASVKAARKAFCCPTPQED